MNKINDNCLAIKFPGIALEWHPIKNGNITPYDVISGSHAKVWWKCIKGHEWEAELKSRTLQKSKCPYCCNQKVCKDNCLATTHPELAMEWHPAKNRNLTPCDIVAGSNKKVWWICGKGHEWETSCSKRIQGHGCLYCVNRLVCGDNCLATTHPNIASEWHPTKNENITPEDVVSGSNNKYWWICNKGHEWQSSPNNRTKTGCPYCSHNRLCADNCLATCLPEIAAEWHPTKNGNITPKDVIAGSGRYYWFQCQYGHEWRSKLCNRIYNGCPRCCESKGEKRLLEIAECLLQKEIITKYTPQYKDPRIKVTRNLPFDVALFFSNDICVIEYQGKQHYQLVNWSGKLTAEQMEDNLQRVKHYDKRKRMLCKKHNIKYLAIRYNQFKDMENIIIKHLNGLGLS